MASSRSSCSRSYLAAGELIRVRENDERKTRSLALVRQPHTTVRFRRSAYARAYRYAVHPMRRHAMAAWSASTISPSHAHALALAHHTTALTMSDVCSRVFQSSSGVLCTPGRARGVFLPGVFLPIADRVTRGLSCILRTAGTGPRPGCALLLRHTVGGFRVRSVKDGRRRGSENGPSPK